ncbi:hypothetical protein EMIHUDRAFT_311135 [Emiliania huxleyi CCMP1516]|uniref:RING-type domain-containing protein n=2 Tax=Emiliania huxleyi TaxID=2903 RepID=A0A0D3IRY8_EMIH1|nr:hypothetical protein EMIHUDRAFT_311135 [Emiliania huxleyi CCMP1516]EOD14023.1 hypothetical protein EMIHUDRAFT_311135 [Emiliania huxleyi CCMP1516]|eukprot:XP_005766452.1 hypothetical protein EMIHUDRAFT_311135 [Emiliania huxleyi CCMP1516]
MADAQPASSAAQDSSAAAQTESAAAVRRLRAAAELIATGNTPECPVCLEQPSAMDARILRCCAAVMCRECVPLCNGICPFCRREFAGIGESCSHDDAERTARQLEARRFRAPSETSPDLSRTAGESPYTYSTREYSASNDYTSTLDYSAHSAFTASNDYSSTRDYTCTADYSSTAAAP